MSITDNEINTTTADLDEEKPVAEVDEKKADATESAVDNVKTNDDTGNEVKTAKRKSAQDDSGAKVSISVRTLALAAAVAVVLGVIGTLAWLYVGAQSKLTAEQHAVINKRHAEEIAQDYAVRAAEMNFQDLNAWKVQLVKGTSPELKDKLSKASGEMEQILEPLQWVSTARPLAAKVRSDVGGIYVVDSFVSVLTKTMQAPEGLQSTATYSLTIDSNKDWQISDVGGIDAALGSK